MNNPHENQRNGWLHYWGLKCFAAAVLIIIGYKTPPIWLAISATIWAGYVATIITSPLLIAASQNTNYVKIANRTSSILSAMATAALISAPIVMLHWYRLHNFNNH